MRSVTRPQASFFVSKEDGLENIIDNVTAAIADQLNSVANQPEDLARAAIEAMYPPSPEMLQHGALELIGLCDPNNNPIGERMDALKEAWEVMLLSALK